MAKKLYTSPRGIAVHPHLTKADFKFKKDYGEYHVKVRSDLSDPKAAATQQLIDGAMKTALDEAVAAYSKALQTETDKEKLKQLKKAGVPVMADKPYYVDEEDGTIEFSFKMAAGGKNSKTQELFQQAPALFDAKLKPIDPTSARIGGGSEIIVSYELTTFATAIGAGASLRMKGVQVLKLVEWGRDAKAMGFSSEDDGYEAEATTAAAAGFTEQPTTETEAPVTPVPSKVPGGKSGDEF
jgi:hypothetical protein